ncbi:hypothetical protein [Tardibacter chloracetimidivorans]|uniref:hypothetical protein n=1 Tax=Tardibacter chloracetimidivorans TaxID=1921510 RepID=UPI001300E078|nr:hypothetical protein [Tardibacter chloracetimidivorans]
MRLSDANDNFITKGDIDPITSLVTADEITANVTELKAITNKLQFAHDYSASSGSVMEKLQRIIDVADEPYGAVCDWNGTTGTDDATAIQAAITAAAVDSGMVFISKSAAIGSTITIPSGVTVDCQWNQIGALDDIDMFHINPGGQLKNARISTIAQTTYSSIVCKLAPTGNTQGDRFVPWADGVFIQFYSSGSGKGTGFYYDASEYYIQLMQGHNLSVRYGEYGIRFVGGDETLEYSQGNNVSGYTNMQSTYSIYLSDERTAGNTFDNVILQGNPGSEVYIASSSNRVSGIAWDDVAVTISGDGNDLSGLQGTTLYGIALTDTGRNNRAGTRGERYYNHTSVNASDDWRHEARGEGRIEFRDFLLGGKKHAAWTETLTGSPTVSFSSAVFGATGDQNAWLPYVEFSCPTGSNAVLWDFDGNGIVRTSQYPTVHFTNYTATADQNLEWQIGLYTDANNFILLEQNFASYSDDDIRLITRSGGTSTTTTLVVASSTRINFCSLLISPTSVMARIKQYNSSSSGATGRVADGVLWDGTEITGTSTTNIPTTSNLEPYVRVAHGASGGSTATMRLMDYQLVAGRRARV